ncbi:MAG TPA: M50 family metallopeptidase [Acidobacteriaceae bacterium]|nr:M50 family metallopeptidase [Acidobacteriaceae bacterium]
MRYLVRRVRFFFLLSAIAFCVLGFIVAGATPSGKRHPLPQFDYYAIGVGLIGLGILYGVAWWTTRKPSPYRNNWAVAASVINLLNSGTALFLHRSDPMNHPRDFVALAIALAGLYAYGGGGTAPQAGDAPSPGAAPQIPAPSKPVPISGDRTHPWVRHLVTVVSLAAEIGALTFWSIWARSHGLLHTPRFPWYFVFTVAVLITTIIHECGHALIAWCFQMRLLSFNAGPLRWRKREGKWSFRLDLEGLFNLGGAVRVVPTDTKQPRGQDLLMIAAGPFANIVTGAFFLVAVLYSTWPHYDVTWRLVALTASFSFIAAITNLFPVMTQDGGYSDGAQILQILTRSPLYDYRRVMNALAATLVTDRRYRDLDINAMLFAAEQFPYTDRAFQMQLFASNYYLDTGSIPDARKALTQAENIVAQANLDIPGPLHTALVFDQAYLNRNAAAARAWWDKMEAKKVERKNFDYWLAKASLHWIEGSRAEAEEAYRTAEADAAKLPHFGAYEFDRSRLSMLRQAMDDPRANLRPTAASRPSVDAAASVSRTAALAALATAPVPRIEIPATSAAIQLTDTLAPASGVAPVVATSATAPARIRSAVPSASSAALAAAASSPEAPSEPRWDPLSFIRNPSGA